MTASSKKESNEVKEQRIRDEETVKLMTALVGEPKSHWLANTWIPEEGKRLYTPDEMRRMFQNENTLFVGDSLQRRVADTLCTALTTMQSWRADAGYGGNRTHTPDVSSKVLSREKCFLKDNKELGYEEAFLPPHREGQGPSVVAGAKLAFDCAQCLKNSIPLWLTFGMLHSKKNDMEM